MSNVRRLLLTNRIFFVTVNLRRTVPPLRPSEYRLIIETLAGSRRRLGFSLHGYVLMPDHWHALIGVQQPLTISRVLHDLKKVSARKIHQARASEGPLWQHQFWDRFVRHAREFTERLEYMHRNPVRKRLVERPEQWPWSSANNYALEKTLVARCPIQIDYGRLPEQYRG